MSGDAQAFGGRSFRSRVRGLQCVLCRDLHGIGRVGSELDSGLYVVESDMAEIQAVPSS